MHDVLQLYQMQIGPLSGAQRDKLYQAYDEGMSPFVIGCARIVRTKRRNLQGQPEEFLQYLWNYSRLVITWNNDESALRAYWQVTRE